VGAGRKDATGICLWFQFNLYHVYKHATFLEHPASFVSAVKYLRNSLNGNKCIPG